MPALSQAARREARRRPTASGSATATSLQTGSGARSATARRPTPIAKTISTLPDDVGLHPMSQRQDRRRTSARRVTSATSPRTRTSRRSRRFGSRTRRPRATRATSRPSARVSRTADAPPRRLDDARPATRARARGLREPGDVLPLPLRRVHPGQATDKACWCHGLLGRAARRRGRGSRSTACRPRARSRASSRGASTATRSASARPATRRRTPQRYNPVTGTGQLRSRRCRCRLRRRTTDMVRRLSRRRPAGVFVLVRVAPFCGTRFALALA